MDEPTTAETPSQTAIRTGGPEAYRDFSYGCSSRADTYKLSNVPRLVEKIYDVVGLYLNPPEGAVVYCVDEKSQVQALARSQPAFPMMPGMPEKRTHDYLRHGTTSLYAALNTDDGTIISSLHRRHRTI